MNTVHDIVANAIRALRISPVASEYEIHDRIQQALGASGIHFAHEFTIGPRCRIDFMAGDVGIEVKKGKVISSRMCDQAARYLAFDSVGSIIVVIERSVFAMPREINGKPVTVIGLNKQWGIAL